MSPRTGRPKEPNSKKIKMQVRLGEQKAAELEWCAENLQTTKTDIIEQGISLVKSKIEKK